MATKRTFSDMQRLNTVQKDILEQVCQIIFAQSAKPFITKSEKVDYERFKSALHAKFLDDKNLKVWELVEKHFSDKYIELNSGKKLRLPLAFNCVVCFHQKEFKGA